MKHYTLTLVFNKDLTEVLMCWHNKQQAYNYIGGTIETGEACIHASYRELFEETGITPESIQLHTVREETVQSNRRVYEDDWHMYVTCGVIDKEIPMIEEKNHLVWMKIKDTRIDNQSTGFGNCRTFLNESLLLLQMLRDEENTDVILYGTGK